MADNPFSVVTEGKENPFSVVTRPNPFSVVTQMQPEPTLPPVASEPQEQGFLRKAFEFVGEGAVGLAEDVIGPLVRIAELRKIPGKQATTSELIQKRVGELQAQGLSEGQARVELIRRFKQGQEPELTAVQPGEQAAGVLDLGAFVAPLGRVAQAIPGKTLLSRSARSAAEFAGFGARFPTEEAAGDPLARAEGALELGLFGAATPLVGKVLAPLGRAGQKAFSNAVQAVKSLLPTPTADKILRSSAQQLQRAFLGAFLRKTPAEVIEVELPKLFQPLAVELRATLSEAGRIIEPELERIIQRGTVSKGAGEVLGKIAREAFPETGTVLISENRVRGIKTALVTVGAALEAAGKRLETKVGGKLEPGVLEQFNGFRRFYDALAEQFIKQRRAAGRILQSFQVGMDREAIEVMAAHLERIGFGIENAANKLALSQTAVQQLKADIASGQFAEAGRTFIRRMWRPLLFPITSFVADTYSNSVRLLEKSGQAVVADVFDVVEGKAPIAVEAMLRGIFHSAKTRFPSVLQPTAFSEQMGSVFGPNLDKVLVTGAILKRGADSQFAKFGFFSSLYESALAEANKAGLQGIERTSFVRRFVLEAQEKFPEAVQKAIARANELRFTEPLSTVEERIAGSTAVQLLLTPFAWFGFQYIRWLAEFTPLSPKFLAKLARNEATGPDFTNFVLRNLTGVGALYFTDQSIYDDVDFDRMEYIDPETKERRSLSGFSPMTELLGVTAIFRGEPDKAVKAFERGSIGFLARQGLLDEMLSALEKIKRGANPRVLTEEFGDVVASMFPAKSVLAGLNAALGQEPRTGLGRVIPGLGRARIDPLTGEAARNQRVISIGLPTGPAIQTDIPASPAFGARLTGRKLNQIEQLFSDLKVKTFFPSATGLIDPATGEEYERVRDVPEDVIEQFKQEVGIQRGQILKASFPNQNAIDNFRKLPTEEQVRRLQRIKSEASQRARQIINSRLRFGRVSIGERLGEDNPFSNLELGRR